MYVVGGTTGACVVGTGAGVVGSAVEIASTWDVVAVITMLVFVGLFVSLLIVPQVRVTKNTNTRKKANPTNFPNFVILIGCDLTALPIFDLLKHLQQTVRIP